MKLRELFEEEERSVSSLGSAAGLTADGNFYCGNNQLTSLKGSPASIEKNFSCGNNYLTSLDGIPSYIGGDLFCENNKLTSLKGIHKQIKHINNFATFNKNPITSHVLGLLKIDGLREVKLSNMPVQKIINKHLQGDRDIFACQEELIEAGFTEFAQL